MARIRLRPLAIVVLTIFIATSGVASGQSGAFSASALPGRCATTATPSAVMISAKAKSKAQQTAGRAQAASIQGDNAAATVLYQKAAALDPSDADVAYALGRGYEATRDARAMREYCRFLTLAPTAAEAGDVRQRIAALSLALPPDTAVVRIPVTAPDHMPAPGTALAAGLIVPGLGQFTTHRPTSGLLVMVASAAAAAYGFQSQNVTSPVTRTATDPLGHSYQYPSTETHSERPHFAVGVGTAAAISVIAALEAFGHAHSRQETPTSAGTQSRLPLSAAPVLTFGDRSIGVGLAFR